MARIVHVSNVTALVRPGQPAQSGGIETLQLQIFERQLADGHQVAALRRSLDGEVHHWMHESGVEVMELPALWTQSRAHSIQRCGPDRARELFRQHIRVGLDTLSRNRAIDIVHIHNLHRIEPGAPRLIAAAVIVEEAKRLGAQTIHHVHNNYAEEAAERARQVDADQQIFVSADSFRHHADRGAVGTKAAVIAVAVDPKRFSSKGPVHEQITAQSGVRIGHPAQLTEDKGTFDLIRAMGIVARSAPRAAWTLTLCDPGADPAARQRVAALLEDQGIADRTEIIDIPLASMPAAVRTWDVSVAPSNYSEAGPQTVIEAIVSGTAVVTTRGGGQEELARRALAGRATEVMVERNDPADLARGLLTMIRDAELRDDLAATALANSSQFHSGISTGRLAAVYAGLGIVPVNRSALDPGGLG